MQSPAHTTWVAAHDFACCTHDPEALAIQGKSLCWHLFSKIKAVSLD